MSDDQTSPHVLPPPASLPVPGGRPVEPRSRPLFPTTAPVRRSRSVPEMLADGENLRHTASVAELVQAVVLMTHRIHDATEDGGEDSAQVRDLRGRRRRVEEAIVQRAEPPVLPDPPTAGWHDTYGGHHVVWVITSCGHEGHSRWWSCATCGERPVEA